MKFRRWALGYIAWAIGLSVLVGCREDEDYFEDMGELFKEMLRIFLQWLLEGGI